MAQWTGSVGNKTDNLSLFPKSYIVKEENPLPQVFPDSICLLRHTHTNTNIYVCIYILLEITWK